jgi:hypothetical protein
LCGEIVRLMESRWRFGILSARKVSTLIYTSCTDTFVGAFQIYSWRRRSGLHGFARSAEHRLSAAALGSIADYPAGCDRPGIRMNDGARLARIVLSARWAASTSQPLMSVPGVENRFSDPCDKLIHCDTCFSCQVKFMIALKHPAQMGASP